MVQWLEVFLTNFFIAVLNNKCRYGDGGLNKAKTGGVDNSPSKWTNKKIFEEAKKYNSIGE